jgi:hypothetical protein
MTFLFTITDRLYLSEAIASERGGDDDVQELRGELFDKLNVTNQERVEYVKPIMGGVMIDDSEPITLELDKHEVRKLKALLLAWKKTTANVIDRAPLASLLEKLTAIAATAK